MPNWLSTEVSPYLLQHAENPVEWYPWGAAALLKAQREQKPIFLSIGYAACHWCHVMAHESFEDQHIASLMNDNFINIKVDREERPDLDQIYMDAVVSLTGHGGWPLSVFLTPEAEPFFGGTYFPPRRRFNMPSFEEILTAVARLWREDKEKLLLSSREISAHLRESQKVGLAADAQFEPAALDQAAIRLAKAYDWTYGGWGAAPKFPQPMAIEYLLQRGCTGDQLSLEVALHALDAMKRGGMHDLVGGGFARYSTDDLWRVPHFEKMLYDNAQLARVYLIASLLTGKQDYEKVCRSTLDFISNEMRHPEGGFYCSLDADSEGVEGRYYIWSQTEINELLLAAQEKETDPGPRDWAEVFRAAYDVTGSGQLDGANILQQVQTSAELAETFQIPVHMVEKILNSGLQALRTRRSGRVRPAADDKVLVAWNALALWAFAEAARYLKEPIYLQIAQDNAAFLLNHLLIDGRLFRLWRSGRVQQPAFLEDHAGFALALLALYQTDANLRWYHAAKQLIDLIENLFHDPAGGYFDTQNADGLLLRPRDLQDNATPSGGSLACRLFGQYGALSGESKWLSKAEALAASILPNAARYPTAYGSWLSAANFYRGPIHELALLYPESKKSELSAFNSVVWRKYRPNLVVAAGKFPPDDDGPGLLLNRPLINQGPTAYLCENFVCLQPVSTPEELATQLN